MTFLRARLLPPSVPVRSEEGWRNDTERVHLAWADGPGMDLLARRDRVVLALRPPEGDTVGTQFPSALIVPNHPNRWSLHASMLVPVENLHAPMLVRMKPEYAAQPEKLTDAERNSWYQAWPNGYNQVIVLFDHPYVSGGQRGGAANQYRIAGAPDALAGSAERACWSIPARMLDIVETPHEVATVATPKDPIIEALARRDAPGYTITDDGQRTAKLVLPDGTEWVRASNVAEVAMEYAKANNWCNEVRHALGDMGIEHETETRWVVTVNLATEFELAVMAKNSEEAEEKARQLVPGRLQLTGDDLDGDNTMMWDDARYDADEDDD